MKGSGWVPKALLNVQRIVGVEEYILQYNVLLMNCFVVITVICYLHTFHDAPCLCH